MTQFGEATANVKFKPDDPKDGKKRIKIRVYVFFDGTLNNRTNIDQRLLAKVDVDPAKADKNPLTAEERAWALQLKGRTTPDEFKKTQTKAKETYEKHGDPGNDNSYEGYYTNIVIMDRHAADKTTGYELTLKTYIEGSGTLNTDGDKTKGFAVGMGPSGVPKKVEQGVNNVVELVTKKHTDKATIIELLTLDVFGFSRGAAGARNFISDALFGRKSASLGRRVGKADYSTSIRAQLEKNGYTIAAPGSKSGVKVCLAGIFDTVSTYGLGVPYDSDDNITELSLNAVFHAEETLHLTAADEHRYHFSLTSSKSAGSRGRQVFLPGVHSDIGGGYRDAADEKQPILGSLGVVNSALLQESDASLKQIEHDKQQLIAAGWYAENEMTIENHDYYVQQTEDMDPVLVEKRVLSVKRSGIHNSYSLIPLHLMVKKARDKGVALKPSLDRDEVVPAEINHVQQEIQGYVNKQDRYTSKPEDWHDNRKFLRFLRHRYFHFSARMSAGHDPRIVGGKRTRKIYPNG